jgi:predicted DNA binding protein
MSLFGEFHVPADEFVFHETFQTLPNLIIEIERVVATDELLTPYFWVSNVSSDTFEAAARDDPTIDRVQQLDDFEEARLYRADWTDRIETLVYAYTHIGAIILEAEGHNSEWNLRMRFDDREKLDQFNEFLSDENISFDLRRLYEIAHPHTGGQFGLTPKQYEALTTAWKMGYFELPRRITMEEVADELDIAPQSLSDRLRRAQDALIEETLRVDAPSDHGFSGVAGG